MRKNLGDTEYRMIAPAYSKSNSRKIKQRDKAEAIL